MEKKLSVTEKRPMRGDNRNNNRKFFMSGLSSKDFQILLLMSFCASEKV